MAPRRLRLRPELRGGKLKDECFVHASPELHFEIIPCQSIDEVTYEVLALFARPPSRATGLEESAVRRHRMPSARPCWSFRR